MCHAGDVIHICVLVTVLPNNCVYWCERSGSNWAIQRNLGGSCPSIIIHP
jgi:hypothetical protein